jgi:hypothetical protein
MAKRVEKSCEHCGKTMSLPKWDSKRRFCDVTCWGHGHREEKSPVYKGDYAVSRMRQRIMQFPEYKEWHAKVLKRDNYTCVLCGYKGQKKEVDHIKPMIDIFTEHKVSSILQVRDIAEMWDTNNGRTLCQPCHINTSTYAGRGRRKMRVV